MHKIMRVHNRIIQRSLASPLQELTCHMGSHSIACHPAEVTFPPLPFWYRITWVVLDKGPLNECVCKYNS